MFVLDNNARQHTQFIESCSPTLQSQFGAIYLHFAVITRLSNDHLSVSDIVNEEVDSAVFPRFLCDRHMIISTGFLYPC